MPSTEPDTQKAEDQAIPVEVDGKSSELESLRARVLELERQSEEYLANWKRERADFTNYRNDEGRRVAEVVAYAGERMIKDLLDVCDRFSEAQRAAPMEVTSTEWYQGLEQAIGGLDSFLKSQGVERIGVTDQTFDPLRHEAVEVKDQNGSRLEEIRAGYTLRGKVIRPARVRIVN